MDIWSPVGWPLPISLRASWLSYTVNYRTILQSIGTRTSLRMSSTLMFWIGTLIRWTFLFKIVLLTSMVNISLDTHIRSWGCIFSPKSQIITIRCSNAHKNTVSNFFQSSTSIHIGDRTSRCQICQHPRVAYRESSYLRFPCYPKAGILGHGYPSQVLS